MGSAPWAVDVQSGYNAHRFLGVDIAYRGVRDQKEKQVGLSSALKGIDIHWAARQAFRTSALDFPFPLHVFSTFTVGGGNRDVLATGWEIGNVLILRDEAGFSEEGELSGSSCDNAKRNWRWGNGDASVFWSVS
jgi:hypothetical protein